MAGWCYRRRRVVLVLWLVVLIGVNVLSGTKGTSFAMSFTIPRSDAQQATDLLKEKFPAAAGTSTDVVFASPTPLADPANKARIAAVVAKIAKVPGVKGATGPFDQLAF